MMETRVMKTAMFAALLGLAGLPSWAFAKDAAAAPPVSADPQQTSATFGDWVVRCVAPADSAKPRICEVAQSLVAQGQQSPVAQIAFAGTGPDREVTVLLPNNISFDKPPQIGTDATHLTTLAFRRCIPAGCLAGGKLDAETVSSMRGTTTPGRLIFTDASERTLAIGFSFRGLAQALNDLSREK